MVDKNFPKQKAIKQPPSKDKKVTEFCVRSLWTAPPQIRNEELIAKALVVSY